MSAHVHLRLGVHLRRNVIAYLAVAGVVALSPVPSIAADLVTTSDIANAAVTRPKLADDSVNSAKVADAAIASPDIKDGTVRAADLADSAKSAKVIRYDFGPFDFSRGFVLNRVLPGTWDAATVAASSWSVTMTRNYSGIDYGFVIPGHADGGSSYQIYVDAFGQVWIDLASGPGEKYDKIFVYRTVVTSTHSVPGPTPP